MPTPAVHRSPIGVRVVRTDADLRKVLALRAAAAPGGAAAGSAEPDGFDRLPNATLLLAESRLDGEALGSLRILTSERGPLTFEGRVALPAAARAESLAEASRLVVRRGRHATLARLMLWKAFHRYCLAAQIDAMLIAVREPADRQYAWLGFTDVLPAGVRFSPEGDGTPTHRLMRLGVFEAHERSLRTGHPLHDFFFVESHPDIELLAAVGAAATRAPRPAVRAASLPDHAHIAAQLQELAIV
ncbi:MAG: hypothetical protein BGO72_06255 [Burkholderiales bacterium 70-64]|nr:MAG: hypothetical protein BGO72_06255 [Burkholderiales bacterium 70-64]